MCPNRKDFATTLRTKTKSLIRECLPPIVLRLILPTRSAFPQKSYTTIGSEQMPEFYDQSFIENDLFHCHYTETHYYPMWAVIADRISHAQIKSVLDIGCGPGQVAALLRDKGLEKYLGIDFSPERIKRAQEVCPEFDFVLADVFKTDLLRTHNYDASICLEYLEHVESDLLVIEALRPGTLFYASVPNFGCKQHVRYFQSTDEITERYACYFKDFRVDEHLGNAEGRKYFLLEGVTKS